MSELVILVPVLQRPRNVKPLLDSVRSTTPGARVLFIPDPSDVEEIEALDQADAEWIAIDGNYPRKINQGALWTTEPLIFLGADDIRFHDGWFEAAARHITGPDANPAVGVVATNDMCNPRNAAGDLATHPLIARWYVERFGTIDESGKAFHENYLHEWCDRELTATVKHRGMYAFAPDSVVEHLHPDVGKAPLDDLHRARPPRMRAGRRVYNSRKHLWGER